MGFSETKRADYSYIDSSDNMTWNVAGPYSNNVLFQSIRNIIDYLKISKFGTSEIIGVFQMNEEQTKNSRITGINWLIEELQSLISTGYLALSDKDNKEKFKKYLKDLEIVEDCLDSDTNIYYNKKYNQRDKKTEIELKEKKIKELLRYIRNTLLIDILIILNRSGVIYANDDNFDPDKAMEDMMEEIVMSG
jgi:hypothetical protein